MPPQTPGIGDDVTNLMPRIGDDVTSLMSSQREPDFRSSNEPVDWIDELADYVTSTIGGLGHAVKGAAQAASGVNTSLARGIQYGLAGQPIEGVKSIAGDADSVIRGLGNAAGSLRADAEQAFERGDYVTGTRKLINYIMTGIGIGPGLDAASDKMEQGKYGEALGDATALGIATAAPMSPARINVKVPRILRNRNPVEQSAVEFGMDRGIAVDAATASGNRFLKGSQRLADESLGGSGIASRAGARQADDFVRVGNELAEEVAPGVQTTPTAAGENVRGAVHGEMTKYRDQADTAYGKLREMEADPANARDVPRPLTSAELRQQSVRNAKAKQTTGSEVTPEEWQELRRIREELGAVEHQRERLSKVKGANGIDEDLYVPNQANAPVYHDIKGNAPGSSKTSMTNGDMQKAIDRALETGSFTHPAKGALEAARKRLQLEQGQYVDVSKPILPPDAGAVVPPSQAMRMPVDLRPVKPQLKPIYDRLKREAELVPLMGDKARALTALDRLMNAPDHAPLSLVDEALGDLKTMARADVPELRTQGQGVMAAAVKHLDGQVRKAAETAGPDVLKTLEEGRTATQMKYEVAKVLDQLHAEPGKLFKQLTEAKDAGKERLLSVSLFAPGKMREVGRAVLEDMLGTATAEGGFQRTAKLWADWEKLGPDTKRLLFGSEHLQDLDRFFLLAKKASENPNPSGTAWQIARSGELIGLAGSTGATLPYTVGMTSLAAVLHSPKLVRLLNRGLMIPVKNKAAATAAVGEFATAAREAGIPLGAPAAAEQSPDRPSPAPQP